MKKLGLISYTVMFLIFLISLNSTNAFTSNAEVDNGIYLPDYSLDSDLTLQVEFFGYDSDVLNLNEIEDLLISEFHKGFAEIGTSSISFDFVFTHATEVEFDQLESYIDSIKITGSGVGYSLNLTQLDDDLASGERNDILIPEDGTVIDARQVENYLYENYYEESSATPGYTMFLLNFTSLDDSDIGVDHWYKITETGFDSNITIDYWFSGYSDIPYVPTLGWGGSDRFCFLDLSARTWYYDWILNAWGLAMGDYSYYTYPDLDYIAKNVSLYSPSGQTILSTYIADYINSYLGNVFSSYFGVDPIGESYSMQIKVFNNLTEVGYTFEELNWVISEERIYNQLSHDFPWIDWIIEVQYVELSDYPSLVSWISSNLQHDPDGDYIEVTDGFYQLLETQLPSHFNYSAADTILPCYFFLTDDIQFKYYGFSFAGLGGMGWQILVNDQYSIFEGGNPSLPRRGMSAVTIHELGHSLGMPHPHGGGYGWGSSYIEEVMNYFSIGERSFSSFYKDGLARAHSNFWYSLASAEMEIAFANFVQHGSISELVAMVNDIYSLLDFAAQDYYKMDYDIAIEKSKLARMDIELLNYYIDNPDQIPPVSKTRTKIYTTLPAFSIVIAFTVIRKRRRS